MQSIIYLLIIPIVVMGNRNCKDVLPPLCTCSETVIDCSNAGINTTEIFLSIPANFPDLISLNMTGNRFKYLEKDLFGLHGLMFQTLEKLDLSNCEIIGIHKHAFIGLPKLDELILSRNSLSFRNRTNQEPGRGIWPTENFLQPLSSSLKILDLSDAFDRKERQEYREYFISNLTDIFNSSYLKTLQYLNLSSNHIPSLPRDIFQRAPVLEYLYLSSNLLYTFDADDPCLNALMELHLQSNLIRRIDDQLIDLIDTRRFFKSVYLSGNPFTCDCDSDKFIHWLRSSNKVFDKNQFKCARAKPQEYADQLLITVPEDKLQCSSSSVASEYLHGVYILCAVAFVGLIALLLCIMYTNRGLLFRQSIRSWMPLGGYQSLGREPEVKAEMV